MRAAPAALLLACAGLGGCLAKYTLPAGEPSARVKVARKATPTLCVHERQAELIPDEDGYARVPAGRPITLTAQFEGHDFVCIPAVTFTPEPDANYLQEFEARSRACSTSIARETGDGPQALARSEPGSYGCRGRP
jgi:hypothetical protein